MEVALVGLLGLCDLPHSKERFLHNASLFLRADNGLLCIFARVLLIFGEAVEDLLDLGVDLIDIFHPRLILLSSVYFAIRMERVLS